MIEPFDELHLVVLELFELLRSSSLRNMPVPLLQELVNSSIVRLLGGQDQTGKCELLRQYWGVDREGITPTFEGCDAVNIVK